jgi:bacterioferritin-associated ferredoxin
MYVCVCRPITENQIRLEVKNGVCSVRELKQRLGVAACCGKCARHAHQIINESRSATGCLNAA